MRFRRSDAVPTRDLPHLLLETLNQLDQEVLILAPGEIVTFSSPGAEKMGLLKGDRLQSPELTALFA